MIQCISCRGYYVMTSSEWGHRNICQFCIDDRREEMRVRKRMKYLENMNAWNYNRRMMIEEEKENG